MEIINIGRPDDTPSPEDFDVEFQGDNPLPELSDFDRARIDIYESLGEIATMAAFDEIDFNYAHFKFNGTAFTRGVAGLTDSVMTRPYRRKQNIDFLADILYSDQVERYEELTEYLDQPDGMYTADYRRLREATLNAYNNGITDPELLPEQVVAYMFFEDLSQDVFRFLRTLASSNQR